jgi:hypothetical protein
MFIVRFWWRGSRLDVTSDGFSLWKNLKGSGASGDPTLSQKAPKDGAAASPSDIRINDGYSPSMTIFELLHQNAIADTDLLRKNDKLGDVFTTMRRVDFAFETGDKQRADDFAEYVNGKSYGSAAVTKIADGRFRVLVLVTMPITQNLIGCVSGFMTCLSRLFRIDYSGWGSVIQKP